MVLESQIEREACRQIFQRLGVRSKKLTSGGERSWCDRMFVMPGARVCFCEFKRPGEVATPLQKHNHEMLRALGFKVEVHDTVAGAFEFVRRVLKSV